MRSFRVVKPDPIVNDPLGLKAIGDCVQINCFLFQGSPQSFDKDGVQITATPIHGDCDGGIGQSGDPARAGILAALIGVHDLWLAVCVDGFVQCFNAEAGIQRI